MMIQMIPGFSLINNVVYIGSVVSYISCLRDNLNYRLNKLGKKYFFLEHGEFFLALRAYYLNE